MLLITFQDSKLIAPIANRLWPNFQAAKRLRLGNMQTRQVSASERRLVIACMGSNLFVAMLLHHRHAIAVIERRRVTDCCLNEGYASGNGACRRICILLHTKLLGSTLIYQRLAIGIGTWSATSAPKVLELLIQSQRSATL